MTIADYHEQLKSGAISVRETVIGYLDRIKKENKTLNAYLEVFDDAVGHAEKIDERIKWGEEPSGLMGVPLAIKDNILIEGKICSSASKILENYVASYDATAIARLKAAGAIFLGRANMDEFAMGASTENSAYGPTKNPHDHSRVPGGSSGGSTAAVAADLAMGALGSETGGSIRQPAAFCGVVGLKPTYGAVSRYGLMPLASSLDQIGPIAHNVSDVELLFNTIAGKDEMDATTFEGQEVKNRNPEVKIIGIPEEYFDDGLDVRIKAAIDRLIQKLEKNYEIRRISLPYTKYAVSCYYVIVPAEASSNLARYDGIRYGAHKNGHSLLEIYEKSRGEGFGAEVRRRILLGTFVLSHGYYDAYYSTAQKVRSLIGQDFIKAFSDVDVILTPATPTLPFKIGEKSNNPVEMYLSDIYTATANLAGVPALSLPIAWEDEGGKRLPIAAQIIAPHFNETALFEVGRAIEELTNTKNHD